MGKVTGFLDYERHEADERPHLDRLADFREFHGALPPERLAEQAARCMDCGIPFCQSGAQQHAGASGCPLNNLIPEWNDLVYRNRWRDALARLHETNDFPEFTGRTCPAPCESACVVGLAGSPVSIKNIEQAIVDRGFAEGWIVPRKPAPRTGRSVAVVGSGPAGLACAAQLNLRGHTVTVYERSDRIGGLLMYGIPAMKLDKGVVQRRVDLLAAEGVKFVTNVAVGRDIPAARLRAEHDAVVLCVGAGKPRTLGVPGETLPGVRWAMDYLTASIKALLDPQAPLPVDLDAKGRDVVVIGGGDTGTDCVGTALRQGCRSLVQLQHNPRPPGERPPGNPWPQWPRVHRMAYGHSEAAALFGADPRVFEIRTTELVGESAVRAVRTVGLAWQQDAAGRRAAVEQAGAGRDLPADLVLLAMGFSGPESAVATDLGVTRDTFGRFFGLGEEHGTGVPGVFTAGDCRRGQSLVVWAIREGREAAKACHVWLTRARTS